jgi:hypothetical protein
MLCDQRGAPFSPWYVKCLSGNWHTFRQKEAKALIDNDLGAVVEGRHKDSWWQLECDARRTSASMRVSFRKFMRRMQVTNLEKWWNQAKKKYVMQESEEKLWRVFHFFLTLEKNNVQLDNFTLRTVVLSRHYIADFASLNWRHAAIFLWSR